jgi:DNA-binding NarL/FixJ family response regulator
VIQRQDGTISILIVDDQELVRAGFRLVLEGAPGMRVVGEASDGREAIDAARRLRPDVTLLDIQMPVMNGLEALQSLTSSRAIVLTTFENDEYVYEALRLGASGFLVKNTPPEQLIAGIRAVASGGALLSPSVTRRVIERFAGSRPMPDTEKLLDSLTEREHEVLGLVARGLSNGEIATELVLSEETVKTHVSNLLGKLAVRDRVQVVVLAYETGLIRPGRALQAGSDRMS